VTDVPTDTPAPIWTPLPTFSQADGLRTLNSWFMGSTCLLPCWGGIEPGKTTWQEVQQAFQPLSGIATVKTAENLNCDFGQCNIIGWALNKGAVVEGDFYTLAPQNVVHVINLDIKNVNSQSINLTSDVNVRTMLRSYGLPAEMLFNADLTSPKNKYLEITLIYPKRQFIINYWKDVKIEGDHATACGGYSRVRLIVLDNPDQLMSLEAVAQAVETKDLDINKQTPKHAYEAINLTDDAFFQYFGGLRERCVSTPVSIWIQ
jgi:hypothetical protein